MQLWRVMSLYFACGLLESGQGESVVALRKISSKYVRRPAVPRVASASPVRARMISWSCRASFSSLYLVRKRLSRLALSNMAGPLAW